MFLGSLYCKQYGPRSYAADVKSRQHFQDKHIGRIRDSTMKFKWFFKKLYEGLEFKIFPNKITFLWLKINFRSPVRSRRGYCSYQGNCVNLGLVFLMFRKTKFLSVKL